ncbi:MAG TPA: biopolymer transporter Tol, partial [Methylomirabilota bacterium]|nr:biopolymer transporter Tol [Methylomirabilota bacterium]
MKSLRLLVCLCLAAGAAPSVAKQIRIPRQPDYHNGRIAFSYLGDIWVANEDGSNPRRLTVHPARDIFPRFSPDGKWIAFSSNRYGNYDVFVIPAEGGEAKQLTFNTASDLVVGWSRDSRRIIFVSARGLLYPGSPNLYEVSVEGGLEQSLPTDWGSWGSYSPDGRKLAFNRHPAVWWRKHYRGSYSADLWVYDTQTKAYRKLLDEQTPDNQKPNNFWPMYGNGEIFFVSDRDNTAAAGAPGVMSSANNLWKIPEGGGKPVQLTHFKDGSLFFPSLSSDGRTIVFEENFGLWKLDTATGKASEVKIDIASDDKENNFEVLAIHGDLDEYDLSPSSHRAVISTHGEIFTIATDRGDVTRVTHSFWRDVRPVWSPDGKRIAFVSDQSGREEVWVCDVDGSGMKQLSDADTEKLSVTWLPDSKSVLYTAADHKLYVVPADGGGSRVLASSEAGNISQPGVAPDGKWVAYAKADRDFRQHVYLVQVAGGEERRLSDDVLFSSYDPRFTPDGKKLIFLGGYVQGGSATLRDNSAALYSASLTREEKDPMSRDIDDEEAGRAADREQRERAIPQRPGQEPRQVEVKIDFDGLERRIRAVTRLSENILSAVPAPDSRSYAFVAQTQNEGRAGTALYIVQENGEQLRRITQSQPAAEEEGGGGGFFGGAIS